MNFRNHTNKFNNRKVQGTFHGETVKFDSKKEYERAMVLLQMERKGEIKDLKRQVPFVLIEKSKGKRAIKYVADFTYIQNGELVVEDVKSEFTRKDKVYCLKKRMLFAKYGIEIREEI